MLNAPAMECDRVNLRWSVPVQKRQQIFETVPVRHRGTSFRVGETFLMQLHRSRPEPRLSTFERCWLGGATGRVRSPWRSGQATRATYSRSAPPDQSARSARRARPLKRTALLAKPMNGINAPQRPDVDRLSTKAEVAGGKSVTSWAEPPPTSWPLGWSTPSQEPSRR